MSKINNVVTMKLENVGHTGRDTTVIFEGKVELTSENMAGRFRDFMNTMCWDKGNVSEIKIIFDSGLVSSSEDAKLGVFDGE